jgi:DNA repair protein RadC
MDTSIRKRLNVQEASSLSQEELLEALLTLGSRTGLNAARRAKFLLRKFGSLGDLINADFENLIGLRHITEDTVLLFRLVQAIANHLALDDVRERETITSIDDLIEYCKVSMSRLRHERFVAIFLDAGNAIITEIQINGSVDHAPVYPREIAKQALAHNAISIILVHNHPSGNPRPSLADVQTTDKITEVCNAIGIRIVDHVIVGRSRYTSFRQAGLLKPQHHEISLE